MSNECANLQKTSCSTAGQWVINWNPGVPANSRSLGEAAHSLLWTVLPLLCGAQDRF